MAGTGMSMTRLSPNQARWAALTRSTTAASLLVTGPPSERRMSGGWGQPAASASARTMRSMAETICRCTLSSKARMLRASVARSGMTFAFVPAWNSPTVTTAGWRGSISRDTMVWSRVTM